MATLRTRSFWWSCILFKAFSQLMLQWAAILLPWLLVLFVYWQVWDCPTSVNQKEPTRWVDLWKNRPVKVSIRVSVYANISVRLNARGFSRTNNTLKRPIYCIKQCRHRLERPPVDHRMKETGVNKSVAWTSPMGSLAHPLLGDNRVIKNTSLGCKMNRKWICRLNS